MQTIGDALRLVPREVTTIGEDIKVVATVAPQGGR
jgi:hypothetical protein